MPEVRCESCKQTFEREWRSNPCPHCGWRIQTIRQTFAEIGHRFGYRGDDRQLVLPLEGER